MSTWPLTWSAMIAWLLAIFSIVTCSPCAPNSPSSCAMYRPARSTAGIAATVMSGSSGLDAAKVDAVLMPTVLHPATRAMITAVISGTVQKLRVFIVPPVQQKAESWP